MAARLLGKSISGGGACPEAASVMTLPEPLTVGIIVVKGVSGCCMMGRDVANGERPRDDGTDSCAKFNGEGAAVICGGGALGKPDGVALVNDNPEEEDEEAALVLLTKVYST